jgi:hypothetical protein
MAKLPAPLAMDFRLVFGPNRSFVELMIPKCSQLRDGELCLWFGSCAAGAALTQLRLSPGIV